MKKGLIYVGLGIFALVILAVGFFYWDNLRGSGPALRPPAGDIGELLREGSSDIESNKEALDDQSLEYYTQGPLTLPTGMIIETIAEDLGKVRVLRMSPSGALLASLSNQGKIVAFNLDQEGFVTGQQDVLTGLNQPHGMVFNCTDAECKLYVAENDQVAVFDYNIYANTASNKTTLINLPTGGRHWTRTLDIQVIDGAEKLLLSIGSSCDVCYEQHEWLGTIMMADFDGKNVEHFARGLRNAVFMAQHPLTGELWATEMGRDNLGDDLPPDEINIVRQEEDYGWPLCYGQNIHDQVFDKSQYFRDPCADATASHIDLQAHSAPLGLAFVPASGWPEVMQHDLLVAYHGSWNRTEPTGYKIMRFDLDAEGNVLGREDLISGWLASDNQSFGRPVDILILPDGRMYISDDKAGVIYLVKHNA